MLLNLSVVTVDGSGVLAYGIGHLDGSLGYRGWRFIYVIEGVFSFLVGLAAVFTLQDTPQKTKGWLTMEDKRFLELRTKFMYGGGGMGAKNEFRWPDVVKAMKVSRASLLPKYRRLISSRPTPGSWLLSLSATQSRSMVSRYLCQPLSETWVSLQPTRKGLARRHTSLPRSV